MKKVLITGANSGFGFLMTLKFARNGYKVFASTRSLEKDGVKTISEISKKENLQIEWLVFDVCDIEKIQEEMKKIDSLDILINNAGFGKVGEIENFSDEDLQNQLDTNFVGMHRMIIFALPLLKKSKGKIINISSIAGIVTTKNYGIYSSSKFAIEGYSESLRLEMKKYGIKVFLVEPGSFPTNFEKNKSRPNIVLQENLKIENVKVSISNQNQNDEKDLNPFVQKFLNFFRKNDPEKVSEIVFKIAEGKITKFRNLVGKDAVLLAFLRKLLPNSLWDFLSWKSIK
ncbi:MAG: oxidoreductase [Patescibacteria group bacterium]